jgi:hypothetical protein
VLRFFAHRGTTCYLNSFLQAIYMLPECRELLFSLDDNDIGVKASAPPSN